MLSNTIFLIYIYKTHNYNYSVTSWFLIYQFKSYEFVDLINIIPLKANWFPCAHYEDMGGVKVKLCLFLIYILDRGLWYASGPGCFTPEERASPPTSCARWIVGCFPSNVGMEILDERIKILPCRESEAEQLSNPQHSDYTDCDITAYVLT